MRIKILQTLVFFSIFFYQSIASVSAQACTETTICPHANQQCINFQCTFVDECTTDAQCVERHGPNYVCGTNNGGSNTICFRLEPGQSCTQDSHCADGSVCNLETHTCDDPGTNSGGSIGQPPIEIDIGPTNETFDAVNPLEFLDSAFSAPNRTPGGIMSRVLMFAFPIAGLILFVMIVWGGFEILAGASDKKSLDSGKNRVTAAIVGFMLLFSSYWMAQILEYIFGISIL